ncbi:RNA polymerase sigma factor [Hymenobacter sp. GOD-10R]|uniref:RNA polymerase sigma factor n=1 Tax=Hymenobacter sp. GOD-10R TaxID=3093922 RepID=UPI002D7920DB|nr:RNA polymerase sigma factor [Hymenobacter sp. GOD-10R]WRQ30640.1 RNA polymerase sigma factor [Hymenobacter sp. GOD-10R]
MPDEQTLWRSMCQGDKAAFRQLHQAHVHHLLNYGLRLHGSLSVVEDCLQDLFVELWHYRARLSQPTSVRFYLLKGLRNKIKAQYKREQLWQASLEDDAEEWFSQYSFSLEPSAEQRLVELDLDAERREQVRQALEALTPRQREILYLRYFNDLSYEQICEVMSINYQAARSQVYQALRVLRTVLKNQYLLALLVSNFFL